MRSRNGTSQTSRHGEGAVPELTVEMLGVVALHPLAGADALVDRAPGRQERRERPEVGGRDPARAERDRRAAGSPPCR
jgi:hypothetical protein